MFKKLLGGVAAIALLTTAGITAAQDNPPQIDGVIIGENIQHDDLRFNNDGWDMSTRDDGGQVTVDNNLDTDAGLYYFNISGSRSGNYYVTLSNKEHSNAVIEIETTLVEENNTGVFGAVCRGGSERFSKAGYYFVIIGDGRGFIAKGDNEGNVEVLSTINPAEAILTGEATNRIQAVCVDDLLALFVNGELVARTRDNTYTSGFSGMVAAPFQQQDLNVTVDYISVYEAELDETGIPDVLPEMEGVTVGEMVLDQAFTDPSTWEKFESETIQLLTEEDRYHVTIEDGVAWGQSPDTYSDIVLQVQTELLSENHGNGYGVACRVNETADGGYFFFIDGTGFAAILLITPEEFIPLVDWTEYAQVTRPDNLLTAVCVDDRLALYVNGELVAETTDDTHSSGFVGLMASANNGNSTDVVFDNLTIREAELAE